MKLTEDLLESRPNSVASVQPTICPKDFTATGMGFAIGNFVMVIAALGVIAFVTMNTFGSLAHQPVSQATNQEVSVCMAWQSDPMSSNSRTAPEFCPDTILLPSPTSCCATIVDLVSFR